MAIHAIILVFSFAIILAGSELFTNGVEWAGHRLEIAEAAVGSLLAAVGTALPETFIPAVALLSGRESPQAHTAVGLGAIVGAPLMLSTVALLVMGVAALAFRRRRGRIALRVVREDARRDLSFFFPVFLCLVIAGTFELDSTLRHGLVIVLLIVYASYCVVLLRLKRAADADVEHGLYFESIFRGDPLKPGALATAAQVIVGTLAILFGAIEFVDQIILFSAHANLNPGVLSLILSPLATELPEKYNSVVWIRQGKDHLALANITGAMVFQSCIPVALGLAYSPWHLTNPELLAGSIALASVVILYINLRDSELGTPTLMIGGAAYAIFLAGLGWLGAL
ncbi:MAG TPA: sodium:calcium antiporter [Patescibacteria group bacterium]|nr:sodium:calcium antiporter [Patescibacteria group bacterium]